MDGTPSTFAELVNFFIQFLNLGVTVIIALAFLVTLWNVVSAWIIHADDPEKRQEGTTLALTAVIVMVVMLSIWGILNLLAGRI